MMVCSVAIVLQGSSPCPWKIPNHKSQNPNKFQITDFKSQTARHASELRLGNWKLFVICCLELGISSLHIPTIRHGGGEEDGIDHVQHAAESWHDVRGVLAAPVALDERLS